MANMIINNVIGQQLTGSLTKLGDGTTPYLTTEDSDILITTASNGSVNLSFAEQFPIVQSQATRNYGSVGTNMVLDRPSGTEEGDLLIAVISVSSTADSAFVQELSGWTSLTNKKTANGSAIYAAYRIAGGSEPADYTWTISTSSGRLGRLIRITGFNPNDPICHVGTAKVESVQTEVQTPGFLSPNYKTLRITAAAHASTTNQDATNDLGGELLSYLSNTIASNYASQTASWRNTPSSTSLASVITWSDTGRLGVVDILINPVNKSAVTKNTYFFDTPSSTNYNLEIPLWASTVEIDALGGGGGGGSGRRSTASENRSGGGGGGAGARTQLSLSAASLRSAGSHLVITIGEGGSGGTSKSGSNQNGDSGGDGDDTVVQVTYDFSTFQPVLIAPGGNGGTGGSTSTGPAGGAGIVWQYITSMSQGGQGGGGRSGATGQSATNSILTAGGGGGAGGMNSTGTETGGGTGGSGADRFINENTNGGAGGDVSSTLSIRHGADATVYSSAIISPGSGGGGGAGRVGAAGGNGGDGYRGGGGGGGAASTTTSGAGGNGGDGYVVVRFY